MTIDINDEVILAARLFLATLFLMFGWRKLRDFSGTVSQMVQDGLPAMPVLAAALATFMELPVAFAVAVGAFTRPSAVLLALYTLGTSLVEHRYWTVKGTDQLDSLESLLQNSGIAGGFFAAVRYRVRGNIRSMYYVASPHHDPCPGAKEKREGRGEAEARERDGGGG